MGSKPLQLKFVQSATRVHQLPELGPEVAFVGRSNVGKSSLINALAHQRQLARVSNTPGRTQLINVFSHVAGGQSSICRVTGMRKSLATFVVTGRR